MSDTPKTTHFGFQEVPTAEKQTLVREVFDNVAPRYDLMNDLMSLGLHRFWKHFTCQLSRVKPGHHVLDLAGGTGDLAKKLAPKVLPNGSLTLADINYEMLKVGRDRLFDLGQTSIRYAQVNAEALPFARNSFNCVTMAFGLRNVTHKDKALESIARVLKPGGQCLILEFSTPKYTSLRNFYDWYSFNIIPKIGGYITNSEDSYKYLVESIRKHPSQDELKQMMLQSGFDEVNVYNFLGGIVACHQGFIY